MTTIQIKYNVLKAAAILSSKKDVRYYLQGVLIQATPNETRAVATDGHLLGAIQDLSAANDTAGMIELIVPRDVIDRLKAPARSADIWVRLERLDDQQWRMTHGTTSQLFEAVDGRFPDYSRVIPTEASGEAAQIDPGLIGRMHSAICTAAGSKRAHMELRLNGTGPAMAHMAATEPLNFVGVIMPLRPERLPQVNTHVSWAKSAPAA